MSEEVYFDSEGKYDPNRMPPSLPPGSPSGVVEAVISTLSKVCTYIESKEDLRPYSALTPGKGLHTEVLFHIADLADLRASLPQAPTTSAAAPVDQEAEKGRAALAWMRAQAKAIDSSVTDDWGPLYLSRVIASRINAATPAPGAEVPRKEAREWLDSCQTCKVVFPKGGYHNCPAVREVREGCTVDERTLANCDGRVRIEILGLRQKVESLEARATELAQELDDWRNREAACCPEDTPFEDEIKALRAKLRALEGAAREVVDNSTLGTVATEYAHPLGATMSQVPAKLMTALEKVLEGAGFHPTKGEEEERRAEDFGDDGLGDYQG